ncbi:cytochrome c peroxidase [Lentimicrobium saccharophilum]|uniref:Cytochrome c peroxidase n=1 Tax=Lentimicrobium saccharophilum TaxID=1678841 RepID=A0A0S7BNU4_9BACT|nr:cytochrome c peroxidase [Lentimicrobium saccharophilum]GAP41996.1 cytochrome c peroxidase [Lentimicrobium saccharophilum]
MKRTVIFVCAAMLLAVSACKQRQSNQAADLERKADSLITLANNFFKPLPAEALNPENPLTPEKVALGKALYYDNRLSLNQTQSCNTCHDLKTFGVDNLPTSPGDNGMPGTRNSPTVLNAALHFLQFWDGRNKDVEEQAGGPVMNPAEMNMPSEAVVMDRLAADGRYVEMFAAAFPEEKNPVTFTNMRNAIGAFERTLLTPARFDKFLAGDRQALTEAELNGLGAFIGTGCTACHNGALLGGNMFQKYPLFGTHKEYTGSDVDDTGRMQVTKNEADRDLYKVPSMRNIAETWPYLHDGSVKELDKTIDIMARAELNKTLTPQQIIDIEAFLKTLTGKVPAEALN